MLDLVRRLRPIGVVILCVLLTLGAACRSSGGDSEREPRVLTEEELGVQLDGYVNFVSAAIRDGAAEIQENSESLAVRRSAIIWKQRIVGAARSAVLVPSPRHGFLDLWALAIQHKEFAHGPEAARVFGDQAKIAQVTADAMESRIEAIGRIFMTDAQVDLARKRLYAFAAEEPITGQLARPITLPSASEEQSGRALGWVTAIPMAPFEAFGGLDRGAAAIAELSSTADRATRRAEGIPEQIVWDLELLLLNATNSEFTQGLAADSRSFVNSVEKFSETADEISTTVRDVANTARTLPAEVRTEVETAIANTEVHQAEFRKTLELTQDTLTEARAGIADAEGATTEIRELGTVIDGTAARVTDAGNAWAGTFAAYESMMLKVHPPESEPRVPPEDEEPFDWGALNTTAEHAATTARDLRGAIESLDGVLASQGGGDVAGGLQAQAEATIDHAEVSAAALVDHAFWRAVQLALVVFVLGVGYRFVSGKLQRSGTL